MLNWFLGIWQFILANPPLGTYLLVILAWCAFLMRVVLRPPKFLKKYLSPEPDYEGIIREINELQVAKYYLRGRRLHAWHKRRGI
jgi:hypothetical protein